MFIFRRTLTPQVMKKTLMYLLVVCFFCASAFTTKTIIPQSPDQISRAVFKALTTSDATTFATTYDIDVPDLEWYKKKIEADSLIAPETKEDFVEEFTTFMHKANKELPQDFDSKWLSYLKENGIKKEDISYINSYYILTNKKLGVPALGLEIKFKHKNSYHYIELSLLEINGKWKGVYISATKPCDKYFDGY